MTHEFGIKKITDDEYFALPAVNASALKAFRKAPILAITEREETAAMKLGKLVHCAILEPNELHERYTTTDLYRMGTKEWNSEEKTANEQGKLLIKTADMDDAMRIRDAVWKNKLARECLEGAETEIASVWSDKTTGLICKAKADAINHKLGILIDVKTTADASPEEFPRSFAKYGYWLQESWYRWGFAENGFGSMDWIKPTPFLFIAAEKTKPYLVCVHEMSKIHHERVYFEIKRLLGEYKAYMEKGLFPGYPDYNRIDLPGWVLNGYE